MLSLLFSGILGLLLFVISRSTIKARQKYKILTGLGSEHTPLINFVSAHSNFCAYAPIFLILLFLLESQSTMPKLFLGLVATLFCIGRTIHFLSLTRFELAQPKNYKPRVAGMILTLISIIILSVSAMITSLNSMINW